MTQIIEHSATIIYNPLAGPADLAAIMESIAMRWRNIGWDVDVQPTKAAGHATKLAEDAVERGRNLVLAAGEIGKVTVEPERILYTLKEAEGDEEEDEDATFRYWDAFGKVAYDLTPSQTFGIQFLTAQDTTEFEETEDDDEI